MRDMKTRIVVLLFSLPLVGQTPPLDTLKREAIAERDVKREMERVFRKG